MYASRTTQSIVGIFTLLGIAALAILSLSLGKVSLLPPPGYTLFATFDNISGLKAGDQVELAGVQIGKVERIALTDIRARVAIRITTNNVPIDADAIAAVMTNGIIGDKYVSIQVGSSDHILRNGESIRKTQSAFILEEALAHLLDNMGSGK